MPERTTRVSACKLPTDIAKSSPNAQRYCNALPCRRKVVLARRPPIGYDKAHECNRKEAGKSSLGQVANLPPHFDPPAEVLIVDNDQAHAETVAESLERVGFHCRVATSGKEGARMIEAAPFDVVITDLVMNDIDGLGILDRSKADQPDAEVILMTGHGTVPSAVEAMRRGAFNYLLKPLDVAQLRANAEKAVESSRLKRTNVELKRRLDERFGFEGVIGDSPQMRDVIERLKRIAPTNASVLIQGETGTGKELVAQAIHQNSPRKNKPFVALNCAALSENILESELFGHVKGAFTDASADRVGKFEFAHGGTMFLDEVGDMPPATQIKLFACSKTARSPASARNDAGQGQRAASSRPPTATWRRRSPRARSAATSTTGSRWSPSACPRSASGARTSRS